MNLQALITDTEKVLIDLIGVGIPGKSEYQLIQEIEALGLFDGLRSPDALLTTFSKHFLTMHCLYNLEAHFLNKNQQLGITPLEIQVVQSPKSDKRYQMSQGSNQHLRDYYANLDNLVNASENSVAELIADFAQRYDAWSNDGESRSILGVENDASWQDIQTAYRQLANKHHPDKGGNKVDFTRINEAYNKLKLANGKE